MGILSGVSDFFGLDIGSSAIRVVQLKGGGAVKSLVTYGATPVDTKTALSEAPADMAQLAAILKDSFAKHRITTANVAVGLPSEKVFSTTVDIDKLSPSEMEKSISYQADSILPTPLNESKIDWAVLGESPKSKDKSEVLISSVTNTFIEKRLDMLEGIGLNVIAFEPESLALARSIIAPDATAPVMVIDIGARSTDIIVVMAGAPRLTRAITTGSDAIVKAAVQNLNIDQKQAEQFVYKFGLVKDKLEGQVYNAITPTVDILASEIDKSIKFFEARYTGQKIQSIIVTGGASVLPEFPLYLANKFGLNVEIGNAWRNVAYESSRQNELIAVSNHFGVAVGLAGRKE